MAEFPALPLWTDAYLGDTNHLDATEHGAYLLLLIVAWRSESTSLPDDDRLLARYARCTSKIWKRVRPVLEPFFVISDQKWVQLRLLEEKNNVTRKRDSQAENGRRSALKRKERHATKRPVSLQPSDQPNANQPSTPISISISSIDTVAKATDAGASSAGSEDVANGVEKAAENHLWSAGKSFLISHGVAKGKAGSLIGKWKGTHGVAATIEAIGVAEREPNLVEVISFVEGVLKQRSGPPRGGSFIPGGCTPIGSPC